LGSKAVKKHFWDKGIIENAEVYFRRQNIEGETLWLVASVVSMIERPIPGYVIRESVVPEDKQKRAKFMNRLTRITALIAKAVDDAFTYSENEDKLKDNSFTTNNNNATVLPDIADDLKLLQTILAEESDDNTNHLQNLLKAVGGGSNVSGESSVASYNEGAINDRIGGEEQIRGGSVEAASVLKLISLGPSASLTEIMLAPEEVKIFASIVSGELSIEKLAHLIFDSTGNKITNTGQVLEKLMIPIHKKHNRNSQSRRSMIINGSSLRTPAKHATSKRSSFSASSKKTLQSPPLQPLSSTISPPLVSMNLSFSRIGNTGMEILSEILYSNTPNLKCLDVSFCQINEKGILSLSRGLAKRRKRGLQSLQGLILNGNTISYRAARDLGLALSNKPSKSRHRLSFYHSEAPKEGYMEDNEQDDELFDDDEDALDQPIDGSLKRRHSGIPKQKKPKKEKFAHEEVSIEREDPGIQLLHVASTSLDAKSLNQFLIGLGESSRLKEIDVSSNEFGADGISLFAEFLEARGAKVMTTLNRLNISNNQIKDDGLAKITRAISKRRKTSMVDLHLSFNDIGAGGTASLMNKLLSQNVMTLSLDNNLLGDAGCQLVAASLTSMHHLSSLNLSFNQIGSRGITTLMRALIGCESLTFLGLSGNVMKISGAIAMGFALAHHPRISRLELFNCCLSQAAQCHIVSGIISNRWVPLKTLDGFSVGPPMAAIGALDPVGQHLGNTECFTIRRNVQMKAMLEWVQASKKKEGGIDNYRMKETNYNDFQSLDFVTPDESNNGAPSHDAFMRMLEWLSRIPFDEDELNSLRQYFYDDDDGSPDGLRGSNGKLNLKYRGDLLAALGSGLMNEMDEDEKRIVFPSGSEIGLNIDDSSNTLDSLHTLPFAKEESKDDTNAPLTNYRSRSFVSCSSKNSMSLSESQRSFSSTQSNRSIDSKSTKCKARITMFPKFFEKLDLLKSNAQEMMNNEFDAAQQDLIAQQFAEASLILLRQLRYQCMSSGLDGWRHGKLQRKVLIVDDSLVTRKLVARAFQKANFIVDTAENGAEGVRMMKESVYDIAFMDIDMPVMNGFDATKALREWEDSKRPGARQPICALTATIVDDFEVHELMKFKECGLDVMESKPCNIPRLFKVVDDVSPLFSDLSISVTQQFESTAMLKELAENK
jgi:CheY-like chemotaxis protein/Ran GTPase-activating protein (RanGAP) involved in mRNA processing and transport